VQEMASNCCSSGIGPVTLIHAKNPPFKKPQAFLDPTSLLQAHICEPAIGEWL